MPSTRPQKLRSLLTGINILSGVVAGYCSFKALQDHINSTNNRTKRKPADHHMRSWIEFWIVVSACGGLGRVSTRWGNLRALVPVALLWTFRKQKSNENDDENNLNSTEQAYHRIVVPLIRFIEHYAEEIVQAAVHSQFLSVMRVFMWSANVGSDKQHLTDHELTQLTDLVQTALLRVESELETRNNNIILPCSSTSTSSTSSSATTFKREVHALSFDPRASAAARRPPPILLFNSNNVPFSRNTTVADISPDHQRQLPEQDYLPLASPVTPHYSRRRSTPDSHGLILEPWSNTSEQWRQPPWPALNNNRDRRRSLAPPHTVRDSSQDPPPLPPQRQSFGGFASGVTTSHRYKTTTTVSHETPTHSGSDLFLVETRLPSLQENEYYSSPPRRRARIANTPKRSDPVIDWPSPLPSPPPVAVATAPSRIFESDDEEARSEQATCTHRARRRASLAVFGRRLHASQSNTRADRVSNDVAPTLVPRRRASFSRRLGSGKFLRSSIFGSRTSAENI